MQFDFSKAQIFTADFRHSKSNIYLACGCEIGWEHEIKNAAESMLNEIVETNYEELHKNKIALDRDMLIMAMIYIVMDMDMGSDYLYALITTHHANHREVEKLDTLSKWIEAGLAYLTRDVLLSILLLVRHDIFLKLKRQEEFGIGSMGSKNSDHDKNMSTSSVDAGYNQSNYKKKDKHER